MEQPQTQDYSYSLVPDVYINVYGVCLMLTITPVLGFEPTGSWQHRPPLGAVLFSHALRKGHGWKHVRHVVALEAHLDLRARLNNIINGTDL